MTRWAFEYFDRTGNRACLPSKRTSFRTRHTGIDGVSPDLVR